MRSGDDGQGTAAPPTGTPVPPTATPVSPASFRRTASGTAWLTLEMAGVQGLSLLVFSAMARFLDAREFGLVSICFVVVSTARALLFDNFAVAVARKPAAAAAEYDTAFWLTLGTAVAACAAVQLLATVADRLFAAPGLGEVMHAMGVLLLVGGLARTQEQWMIRHFRFRALALRALAAAVLGGVAGLGAAAAGLGVWSLVAQQLVLSLAGFAGLWAACPWRPGLAFSRPAAREIGGVALRLSGGSLGYAVNTNGDLLLIGLVYGPASAGVYGLAKRLLLALQLVAATPVRTVALPTMAEAAADPARLRAAVLDTVALVAAVCAPVFLGAAALETDAIELFFGPRWVAVGPVFAVLALGGLLNVLNENNNAVFLVGGRPAWPFWTTALGLALVAPTFALLSAPAGPGLALAFVLPPALVLPASLVLVGRLSGAGTPAVLRRVLPPLAVATLMFAVLRLAEPVLAGWNPALRLAALIPAGAAFYAAGLALLAPGPLAALLRRCRRFVTRGRGQG